MQSTLTRRGSAIEIGFTILFSGLLVYSLADWFGLLPWERGSQPLRMVVLSSALLLQPIASIIRLQSRPAFLTLLGISAALIATSFFVSR